MANVAEGFGKLHAKERRQGFNHCIGSANEVQNHFYLALDLGYCDPETFKQVYDLAERVIRLSKAFIRKAPSLVAPP